MLFPLTPSTKYIMIEEFTDEILNEIKRIESLREQELDGVKGKLNMLDDEINDILEKLDVDLRTLELRCNFLEKRHDLEDKIELRLSAKNRINEIKRLKDETKNKKDELLDDLLDNENKFSKLLTDLEYQRMIHCIRL